MRQRQGPHRYARHRPLPSRAWRVPLIEIGVLCTMAPLAESQHHESSPSSNQPVWPLPRSWWWYAPLTSCHPSGTVEPGWMRPPAVMMSPAYGDRPSSRPRASGLPAGRRRPPPWPRGRSCRHVQMPAGLGSRARLGSATSLVPIWPRANVVVMRGWPEAVMTSAGW